MMQSFAGRDLRISPSTKLVFKLALHHASRAGRQSIESADLLAAGRGTTVTITFS